MRGRGRGTSGTPLTLALEHTRRCGLSALGLIDHLDRMRVEVSKGQSFEDKIRIILVGLSSDEGLMIIQRVKTGIKPSLLICKVESGHAT
jgi:hypothetical protein